MLTFASDLENNIINPLNFTDMMSNEQVIKNFVNGKSGKSLSMTSTGDKLYSYYTIIAQRTAEGKVLMNSTKYSVTTSKQQTLARYHIGNYVSTTQSVPRGTTDLTRYL